MVKKDLNTLLATKILKKIDLYVYFSQKLVHIENTLMKLSIYIYILIKDDKSIKKYKKNWKKVKNNLKKEFDSDPIYNENYLKAKVKSCSEKITRRVSIYLLISDFDWFCF